MEETKQTGAFEPDTPANPHKLWRQIFGLVFWAGVISFFSSGFVGAAVCLLLGGLTFADAWLAGIYKDPRRHSFLNISPMAWGIAMALLFIVAYPVYLVNRNKLRTLEGEDGLFIAVIVMGAIVVLATLVSIALAISSAI
jgi:hypothetical protein